jgi:hypothetical protein
MCVSNKYSERKVIGNKSLESKRGSAVTGSGWWWRNDALFQNPIDDDSTNFLENNAV